MAPAAMPPIIPAPTAQPTHRASAVLGAATETRASALALATTVRNLVMVLVPRFEFHHHNAPRAQSFQGWDTGREGERAGSAAGQGESERLLPYPWGIDPAINRVNPWGGHGVLREPIALIQDNHVQENHA